MPGSDLGDLDPGGGGLTGDLCRQILASKTVRKSTKQAKKSQNFPPAAGPRSVFLKVKSYFIEYKYKKSPAPLYARRRRENFDILRSFIWICKAKLLAAGAKILVFCGPFIGI